MLYCNIITSRIKYLFRKIMAHFYPNLIQHRCEEEENEVDEKAKLSCLVFSSAFLMRHLVCAKWFTNTSFLGEHMNTLLLWHKLKSRTVNKCANVVDLEHDAK